MSILTNEVLSIAKNIAFLPSSQVAFSDEELLLFMDKILTETMYPSLISTNMGYFLSELDIVVPPTSKIRLPQDSFNSGVQTILCEHEFLTFIPSHVFNEDKSGYSIIGNTLVFSKNHIGKTVRVTYIKAPLKCVIDKQCGLISQILGPKLTVSFNLLGSPLASIVRADGEEELSKIAILSRTNTSITLFEDVPSIVEVGDYACAFGTSCVINLPQSYKTVLAQLLANEISNSMGDFEAAKTHFDKASTSLQSLQKSTNKRSESVKLKSNQGLFGGGQCRTSKRI